MFDGVVVIASFVLDIVFIKGLTVYPLEETVQILAFLMPWRVIRVANSKYINAICNWVIYWSYQYEYSDILLCKTEILTACPLSKKNIFLFI